MRSFFVVVATLLEVSLSGCGHTHPKSELYDAVGSGKLTLGALRLIVRDCARRFPAVLEGATIRIGQGPTTAEQRSGLAEFRANGVPMVQSVLLQHDPVAAVIDGWVLLYQLRDFLVRGAIDPARLPETVATIDGLANELGGLWAMLTGGSAVAPARDRIEAWARAHPLRGSLLARDSATPLLASMLGHGDVSVLDAAGSAVESLEEAVGRLDLYAISLPRQARWQAEAALGDLVRSPETERAIRLVDHAVELAEPLSDLAGETGAILSRERTAVLAGLRGERAALESFLREERHSVLAGLATEREAALQQADGVARGLVDRAFDRAKQLLLLTALAALCVVVAAALVSWFLLSRGHHHGVGSARIARSLDPSRR